MIQSQFKIQQYLSPRSTIRKMFRFKFRYKPLTVDALRFSWLSFLLENPLSLALLIYCYLVFITILYEWKILRSFRASCHHPTLTLGDAQCYCLLGLCPNHPFIKDVAYHYNRSLAGASLQTCAYNFITQRHRSETCASWKGVILLLSYLQYV